MIPRIKIAHGPTYIEPLPRLGAALGGARLWIKRDDQTGLGMGGNKTRKLEYSIAEALANGAKTVVTVGAAQSNHCRQTAAAAARMGLGCILVLSGEPPAVPDGNLLLDYLFGAEIVWCAREERDQTLKSVFEQAWTDGRRPYLIPLGASNYVGTRGYAAAFEEFMGQRQAFDWMVVASSSGGTQAGLVLGARRVGWTGKILGISIDHPAQALKETVAGLVNGAADLCGEEVHVEPEDILVNDDYLGEGYGVLNTVEVEAIQMFARLEGVLLDPVYTGRAAAGLIDLCRKGYFEAGERILFWHTGGTPALFAGRYSELLLKK